MIASCACMHGPLCSCVLSSACIWQLSWSLKYKVHANIGTYCLIMPSFPLRYPELYSYVHKESNCAKPFELVYMQSANFISKSTTASGTTHNILWYFPQVLTCSVCVKGRATERASDLYEQSNGSTPQPGSSMEPWPLSSSPSGEPERVPIVVFSRCHLCDVKFVSF